jgi:flagellar hook-length control protein FliK
MNRSADEALSVGQNFKTLSQGHGTEQALASMQNPALSKVAGNSANPLDVSTLTANASLAEKGLGIAKAGGTNTQNQAGLGNAKGEGRHATEGDDFFKKPEGTGDLAADANVPLKSSHGNPESLSAKSTAGASAGLAAAHVGKPAPDEANVQALLKQAQYMIKKGGGEVKVQMHPEGMGRVDLKVQMQDGKVNVQMLTETNEAKKLLEDSVHDLRNHLAAHKLTIDSFKVETGNPASAENNTQHRSMDSQSQMGREQARQMFAQLRDESNQQRQGMFEAPGFKAYSPKPRQNLEPVATNSVSPASRSPGRLDLVA